MRHKSACPHLLLQGTGKGSQALPQEQQAGLGQPSTGGRTTGTTSSCGISKHWGWHSSAPRGLLGRQVAGTRQGTRSHLGCWWGWCWQPGCWGFPSTCVCGACALQLPCSDVSYRALAQLSWSWGRQQGQLTPATPDWESLSFPQSNRAQRHPPCTQRGEPTHSKQVLQLDAC